ncbi:MAG: aliphatic nitrilase, partial [Paraburkholderia hospita]
MSEQRIIRAAAVQIAPDFERPGGTLDRVCAAIDEAASKGVQLIVFP